VAAWLPLFIEPGQVTELRAINYTDHPEGKYACTMVGYFDHDHLEDMAREALRLTPHAEGVYFIPNPVNPELIARANNRVRKARSSQSTCDENILRRRWILIDADPQRPVPDIASTDEEKAAAWEVIGKVMDYLEKFGITETVLADSGNGYHLLVPVDLPVDDREAVRQFLNSLADRFDTDRVKIDRKVYNPARVCKLYGTWARKGDHTERRPHRQARVLEAEGLG
jgi:hypothetical protein